MASADAQTAPADSNPGLPDYLRDPNAVLKDHDAKWRYGRAPDYSNTRKVYEETKKMYHVAGSLPELVQNLVKNWEVEASFKPNLSDWRTIDHKNYTFAINGGPPQTAEHMLKVGTYNAIICPNEYYSPEHSDFASSHKTFKRMMPTFAWEVLEVYSGPPQVAFRWRHWGTMKNDYVGFNDKGQKVTAKAHGGPIDIEGVTVATVDDKVRLQNVRTWFDPLEMFRQIAPNGVVNKESIPKTVSITLDDEDQTKEGLKASQDISDSGKELLGLQLDGTVDAAESRQAVSAIEPTADGAEVLEFQKNIPRHVTESTGHIETSKGVGKSVDAHDTKDNSTEKAEVIDGFSRAQETEEKTPSVKSDTKDSLVTEKIPHTPNMKPNDKPTLGLDSATESGVLESRPSSSGSSSWTKVSHSDGITSIPSPGRTNTSSNVNNTEEVATKATGPSEHMSSILGGIDQSAAHSADLVHPHPKDMEARVNPGLGEAVAAASDREEARLTHEEMSNITSMECPFLMNLS